MTTETPQETQNIYEVFSNLGRGLFRELDHDHNCCTLRPLFSLEADKAWNPVSLFINNVDEEAACKI